ncbi:MBL fold metallo-hydrolase [Streptomyces heilongjiangensis]|uniref:MBL fold metallo-hydrolase n=1 Tax=Streptomyces heilongjiangensis TaxID=945052 RepID=A0ABW1BBC4_9ACTN
MSTATLPEGAHQPRLREAADGVFACAQPDGGWCLDNVGLIVSKSRSALIDTAATEDRARALKQAVGAVVFRPPGYVVSTDSHGDRTFGNHLFAQDAVIITHEKAREEVEAVGLHLTGLHLTGLHLTGLRPDVRWGELSVELPTLTFRDTLTLHVGDVRAELIRLGPAHTADDTIVWLPEQRVLFTGDLIMSGATPFCLMGSVSGSIAAAERLRALGPLTVVAGQRPVARPELLDTTRDYLRLLQRVAQESVASGTTPGRPPEPPTSGPTRTCSTRSVWCRNVHRA